MFTSWRWYWGRLWKIEAMWSLMEGNEPLRAGLEVFITDALLRTLCFQNADALWPANFLILSPCFPHRDGTHFLELHTEICPFSLRCFCQVFATVIRKYFKYLQWGYAIILSMLSERFWNNSKNRLSFGWKSPQNAFSRT